MKHLLFSTLKSQQVCRKDPYSLHDNISPVMKDNTSRTTNYPVVSINQTVCILTVPAFLIVECFVTVGGVLFLYSTSGEYSHLKNPFKRIRYKIYVFLSIGAASPSVQVY